MLLLTSILSMSGYLGLFFEFRCAAADLLCLSRLQFSAFYLLSLPCISLLVFESNNKPAYLQYIEMHKTQQEIEFEQNISTLSQQFQIFQNPSSTAKLTENRINDLEGKLKNLKAIFNRMNDRLKSNMKNKNYNEFDIKNKIKKHLESYDKIKERFDKLKDRVYVNQMKEDLVKNRTLNQVELDDMKRMNDHRDRAYNIARQAQQTLGIMQDTNMQLDGQGRRLREIGEDAAEFEHELGMADQLMRVIGNRELATKLIVVLLVFFLGLADVLILGIKLLGK